MGIRVLLVSLLSVTVFACGAADVGSSPSAGSAYETPGARGGDPAGEGLPSVIAPPDPATDPAKLDTIDVTTEGAVGDGATDDASAITTALAKGASLGRRVLFPRGRYRVASGVSITLAAGQILTVEGQQGAVIVSDAVEPVVETGAIDITGAGVTTTSEVHITGLAVELARTARGVLDGLRLHDGMSRVTLDRVTVTGASRWGIALERVRGGRVDRSTASDNRYGGLGLDACADLVIEGGVYSSNGTVAPVDGYGVSCMSSETGPSVGITIHAVVANANKRKGIDVHSGHQITIDACSVTGFDSSGIYAVAEDSGKDVADVTITNNVVDGTGAAHYVYGIEVGSYSGLALTSNTFTIRGNTIRHTSFTTSSAIMIRNPTAPGVAPVSVIIDKNIVTDGAAPDAFIVRGDNYDVPIANVVVKDNILGASSAAAGIGLLRTTTATVTGNTIAIASGSVAYGILVSKPGTASIAGNTIGGGATYGVLVQN